MVSNIVELIHNFAVLVALSLISGLIAYRKDNRVRGAILQGLLFGSASVIGMLRPLVVGPGLIFDGRSVMISLCGLFFGPMAAVIAGAMACLYRIILGGQGLLTGLLIITSSAFLGLIFYYGRIRKEVPLTAKRLLVFGLVVHAAMVLLLFTLPGGAGFGVAKRIGLPIVLVYPLITLLIGEVLISQEVGIRSVEDLKQSSAQLRALIDTIPDVVWLKDPAGVFLDCNQRFECLLGAERRNIVGKTDYDFVSRDLAKSYRENDLKAMAAGGPTINEEQIKIASDGHEEYLETIKTPIFETDGRIAGILGIGRDITSRKQAEAAMLESEGKFRSFVESAPDGIFLTDRDQNYRLVNPAACAMTGYTAEEFAHMNIRDLVPPEDVEEAKAVHDCLAKDGWLSLEIRLRRKDGSTFWADLDGVKMDEKNLLAFCKDITGRKQAEKDLRESEARFVSIAENSPVAFYRYSDRRGGVYYSPRIVDLLGYSPEELLADPILWQNSIHPEDRLEVIKAIVPALSGQANLDLVYRIRDACGQEKWFRDRATSHIMPDGEVILDGVAMDITEAHLAANEKAKLATQLQEAHKMESLGVLSAGVAHNLNNILTIIMGNASLREQAAASPLDREAYLGITKACARGRDVVKSMLHFSQPALSIKIPVELHTIIKEVRVLLENTTRNAINISEMFAGEPLWINGDGGSLNHSILNLCLNSLGAMPNGGTLSLRTSILEENLVEVSVEDNGTGMTPEVLGHAMEPFYTTKEVGKGTGLGLSMTYGVIKAHGGSIEIASQPGQGTIVKLRFPRIDPPVKSEPGPAHAPGPSLGSWKVFLVDDDEDVRFLMTRMLKKAGVRQVKVFPGGKEVLESLGSEELPDLIILDQNMPGMNGTQTMEQIRRLHPEMPILISSGQPDIETWDDFKQPKVDVISKPFNMEEIQAKVAKFASPLR